MEDLMNTLDRIAGEQTSEDRRGQLVLVAGLALAVILVAFVLLANTAIFTENLATRDNGVGEHDALGYRSSVVDGVGGIVDRENENAVGSDDYDAVKSNINASISALDEQLRGAAARSAASARINESGLTYTEGRLIRQTDASREFRAANGDADWAVVTDTDGVRAFAMDVDPLASGSPGSLSGVFTIIVNDTSDGTEWRVYVYETGGDVVVAVEPDGGSQTQVCAVAGTTVTLDLTAGTLDGEACSGLDWAAGVTDEYSVKFANGDEAQGTYDLTAAGGSSVFDPTLVNDDPSSGSPYAADAVYAVDVPVRFQTPELEYAATIRVAPGEHDA